ncbi:MAG: ABC transporter permease [Acidobacteria bacterium]|nr:ABC transporter permease [Acidobacteriota bacterium]
METLWQDLRYSARQLARSPGFTAVAVLTLALGIGANTATFTIVKSLLALPLPYHEPERIMLIAGWNLQANQMNFNATLVDSVDFAEQSRTLDVAFYRYWSVNLTGTDDPERVQGYYVSQNTFPMLGVEPFLGRNFRPEEAQPGGPRVVILEHGLWTRRFGADPGILGRAIGLNGEPYTVIGVMPPRFEFPQVNYSGDLWVPVTDDVTALRADRSHSPWGVMVGRLREGVPQETAQAEVDAYFRKLAQDFPQTNAGLGARLIPLQGFMGMNLRPGLYALLAAVGLVLLIVCSNVANLLLARGITRQKEIAIRAALGAGRWRITRQLLVESMLLSLLGGAGGAFIAVWAFDLYRKMVPPIVHITTPSLLEVGLDRAALGFTVLLAVLAGALAGIAPALQSGRADLRDSLKEGEWSSAVEGPRRLRSLLVIGEVALSLVLLISAGLLIRTYARLVEASPGFNPQNVLSLEIALSGAKYAQPESRARFYEQLLERVAALPDVRAAAIVNRAPMSTANTSTGFLIEGRPEPAAGEIPGAYYRTVSADYFRTLGIPLLRGRGFGAGDTAAGVPVAVVNQAAVRQYWQGGDPVGQRIRVGGVDSQEPWRVIVGVAGNVHHWSLDRAPEPEVYLPHPQAPDGRVNLMVRTAGEPLALVPSVRAAVRSLEPDQPAYSIEALADMVTRSYLPQSMAMYLMSIFASIALALAMVGLYGLIAFNVSRRTHEIGVRMALGAQRRDVLRLVIGSGMKLALVGVGLGLLGAVGAAQVIRGLLFETSAADPVTFVGVPVLLLLVGLLASWIPARRAMRVDPMVALRYE